VGGGAGLTSCRMASVLTGVLGSPFTVRTPDDCISVSLLSTTTAKSEQTSMQWAACNDGRQQNRPLSRGCRQQREQAAEGASSRGAGGGKALAATQRMQARPLRPAVSC